MSLNLAQGFLWGALGRGTPGFVCWFFTVLAMLYFLIIILYNFVDIFVFLKWCVM